MIYLACPYNHPDPDVRRARFDAVTRVAADFMSRGIAVFSPITHSHPIAEVGDLPRGWDFWADYDRRMIEICDRLVVLKLDGWRHSAGVAAECEIADRLAIPVEYLEA